MLVKDCRVVRVRRESHDTKTIELEPPENKHGFAFSPGQFNMLYVYGIGEVPISISGNPGKGGTIVHTVRMVGAVTRAIGRLRAGDSIGLRGPYGTPWPIEEATGTDVLLVTGGIGLAPLRPVAYHLVANREKYGRIVLLYGARTPEDLIFRSDLERWRSRFDLEIIVTVDRATGSWRGNVGVVPALIGRSPVDPHKCTALVCGPEIMMRFTILELEKRGIQDNQTYISMERNMQCGIGLCGHCQIGPTFACKDGPVYRFDKIRSIFTKREM